MGLIKSAIRAIGSEMHDQWKDFIKCDDMDMNTLMVKKTTENGVISKNSAIMVSPGQIAVIFESGKILDATAEEGIYNFDSSTSPSFFAGQFGAVFKDMWQRFTYGGAVAKEQAVFYINAKEIIDNKFGTAAPVPFQDYSHAIPNQMTGVLTPLRVQVRCFGKYTYKIFDPAIFMRTYAGTADVVTKELLNEQMRSEVMASFQNVLNELGNANHKVPVLELPSNTDEIKKAMDEKVFDEPIRNRGIQITGFAVESVTLDDESNKKIDEYEHNSNSMMQQGRVLDVMEKAASNANGAANGFMGVGMMNMASGGMNAAVMQNAFSNNNQTPAPEQTSQASVQEENNGAVENTSSAKFCPNCGTKSSGGNFCTNCGTKLN